MAQLQIRHAQEEDFHVYTIVAENSVSVAAKDVPLLHSQTLVTMYTLCNANALLITTPDLDVNVQVRFFTPYMHKNRNLGTR